MRPSLFRGDAIAGILITLVNIVGGFAVGVFDKGWTVAQSLSIFTKLTIGDGLVSQLPAFVISLAAGLIVTRSSGRGDLGTELTKQLTGKWRALAITSGFLGLMAFTGLPPIPMLLLGGAVGLAAWRVRRGETDRAAAAVQAKQTKPTEQPVEQMLVVDTMELEVGYGLVKLVDKSQGGSLLERVSMIRRQLAGELGLVMPPLRIRDNMQLQPNDYQVKIRGNSVAEGQIYPGQFLAMDSGLATEPLSTALPGVPTKEPAFGLDAVWIDAGQKQRAESLNFTVVDGTSVLATHITEVVKAHAHELLSRQETNNLIEQLKQRAAKLVEEVLGGDTPLVRPSELQKVLQNLLRERVPVRDLETVVETLGDWAPRTKDIDVLTEYVRNALRRTICNQYVSVAPAQDGHGLLTGDGSGDAQRAAPRLFCVSLDPSLEDQILGYIDRTGEGTTMSMPPSIAARITTAIVTELQTLLQSGHQPVVLASPQVRGQVRRLLEPTMPQVAVLGYNEVSKGVSVESVGMATLEARVEPQAVAEPELQGVTI